LLAGFMGESVAKSNREARLLVAAARRMLEPERTSEDGIRTTATAVRGELGRLEGAIGDVAERLKLIESGVESQTSALNAASNNARGGADQLVATMETERNRLDSLLAAMAELTSQAQASTQLASQNIEERAAKLAKIADGLVSKSTQASQVASDAALRLDGAAQRAVDAIEQLDQAANRGEAALARAHDLMVLARLRADEAVGSVGSAVTSLHDAASSMSDTARVVSQTIHDETSQTKETSLATVEEIRVAALANAQVISDTLRNEAETVRNAGAQTLEALKSSAEAMRFAAEEAHQKANQQMVDNQRQLDNVRQTAFEAGKDADSFMQTRMTDARALIEQSATLLDDTGNKIQERFGRLAAACADQARSVEDLLDGLDRRLATLPLEADARAKAIEAALNDTLVRLTHAGRRAADETAALDIAFQERLRDSYAALGEVVQRLGGLSGVLGTQSHDAFAATAIPAVGPKPIHHKASPPPPLDATHIETSAPVAPAPAAAMATTALPDNIALGPVEPPTPSQPQLDKQTHQNAPLRAERVPATPLPPPFEGVSSRLKISSPVPIEDDPFEDLQIGRLVQSPSDGENSWSWKQLLSSLDAKGEKAETGRIAALLSELSLDTAISDTTLDKLRGFASRSRDQARRATREFANAEVRAMRQRLTSDPDLRANIVRFVEARREAASRGRLTGNEARVYLVADAALEA
jgi:hypothetical protein